LSGNAPFEEVVILEIFSIPPMYFCIRLASPTLPASATVLARLTVFAYSTVGAYLTVFAY
jgi:hypothetical protein